MTIWDTYFLLVFFFVFGYFLFHGFDGILAQQSWKDAQNRIKQLKDTERKLGW